MQLEIGQPLIILTYIADLMHLLSILTLFHPTRRRLTLPLLLRLRLNPRQLWPRRTASIFEIGVVHLILALETFSYGQHVLIFPSLHADIVECVLQQSHLFSRCFIVLGPDFLSWWL